MCCKYLTTFAASFVRHNKEITMPRGESFGTERIDRPDETTGVLVRQITSFPLPSLHLHYETPTFTPDGNRMLFVTQRELVRGASWDVVTCASDGRDMVKLSSDADGGASNCCMTVDGEYALYMEGATAHRTRLDDASDEVLGTVEDASGRNYYRGARSSDGKYYFSAIQRDDMVIIVRWNLATGNNVVIADGFGVNHPRANPGAPEIEYGIKRHQPDGRFALGKVIIDTDTLEQVHIDIPNPEYERGHTTWMGQTGGFVATLKPPGKAVVRADRGADQVEVLAEGPYFWHCGASYDGEWVIADTNWPDEGLWLINASTKKRALLCFGHASQGHPQTTHTHPNLSDDGRMAVYTSDRTGTTQVYVAYVPDEMRRELSS
jgi:oligogalacturonide lyase